MKEYDIFLPLTYNDGEPIQPSKFRQFQETLAAEFGAYTYFPQPNEGVWRYGDVTYRDTIVIYRVVSNRPRAARRFITKLKQQLLRDFRQEDIFIIEREVDLL